MNDRNGTGKGLLPPGMNDILPPAAAFETRTVERLLAAFRREGYRQVKPPLIEFEDSLLGGAGAAMTQQTFRLMDPVSHAMLGLRADMTLQVARIATTRLAHEERPLRLCYAGQVLQVSGSQLRPERQVGQAGVELIGSDSPAADAEVIALAHDALAALGVERLTIDLNVPTVVPAVIAALGLDAEAALEARAALDRKNAGGLAALGTEAAGVLGSLLAAGGPADKALAALDALDLPGAADEALSQLADVVARVREQVPGISLTIDPVENRGFEYHTGVAFVIFAVGERGELGRGGRYLAGGGANGATGLADGGPSPDGEPATGFTLFMDTVLRALPAAVEPERVFLPAGTALAARRALQDEGWITVAGLVPVADPAAEARRLRCSHVLEGGKAVPVAPPPAPEEKA